MAHRIVPGARHSPVLLHVPHAATAIPAEVRAGLLLDDGELAAELAAMTDAHTGEVARAAADLSPTRPWLFLNTLSRLVIDPERFPDDREEMAAVGMGAVYTRTSDGRPLRTGDHSWLLDRWFEPYARGLADLVDARLAAVGRVSIVDVHSYPRERLPYERGGAHRPAVCLGRDADHTPDWLLEAARASFAVVGDTAVNTPFAGCYVPLRHYRRDERVTGVMVELRRDVAGEPGVPAALAALIASIEGVAGGC